VDKAILISMAKAQAIFDKLDPVLVCAVCERESSWNTFARRFEPSFLAHYKANFIEDGIPITANEEMDRATSWGLMQVLGEVAREHGFTGPIPTLCEPLVGLEWGCIVLKAKLATHNGDVEKGLLAYNGGADPAYAAKVMALMPKYQDTNAQSVRDAAAGENG
jgi:soluble lytic murein transglycosylase-like protein